MTIVLRVSRNKYNKIQITSGKIPQKFQPKICLTNVNKTLLPQVVVIYVFIRHAVWSLATIPCFRSKTGMIYEGREIARSYF